MMKKCLTLAYLQVTHVILKILKGLLGLSPIAEYCYAFHLSNHGMLVKRGDMRPPTRRNPPASFLIQVAEKMTPQYLGGGILGTLSRTTTWATTKSCIKLTITVAVTITVTITATITVTITVTITATITIPIAIAATAVAPPTTTTTTTVVQGSADRWCQCCTGTSLPRALENVENLKESAL